MDEEERSRARSHSLHRPQSLLEKENSEDCIGWDESKNLDLRKIASPHFQTPRTQQSATPSTSDVASSLASPSHLSSGTDATSAQNLSKKPRNSLGEVSRCLAVQSTEEQQEHQERPTTAHKSRSRAAEEEMDGIFHRLEHEQATGNDLARAAATLHPTPRQRNTRPGAQPPLPDQHQAMISAEALLPIKSRKRRRRERALQMARERVHEDSGTASAGSSSPNPDSVHPPMKTDGGTSSTPMSSSAHPGSDDFQDLLKKVKTPSPDMPPPPQDRDEALSRVGLPVTNMYKTNSQSSSQTSAVVPLQSHPQPHPKPMSQPVNNMYKRNSQSSQSSQTSVSVPLQSHPPPHTKPMSQPVNNMYKSVHKRSSQPFFPPVPVQPINASAGTNLPSNIPVPFASTNKETTTATTAAADDDDDEFGDVDFSLDDIALMDSLVTAATQGGAAASCPPNAGPTERATAQLADAPQPVPPATTAAVPLPVHPTSNKNKMETTDNNNEDDDDPFGEFPEIDFGELDKTIAQRELISSQREIDGSWDLQRDLRLLAQQNTKNAVPAAFAPVCNPRVIAGASDICYLSFSRYKVMRVDIDNSTYTKTLAVASWQTAMLQGDDPKAIHRSDAHGRVHLSSRRMTWPIAGVLHLRGEWYHTRVAEGDIIHVCSLRGVVRTDSSALPLILHTNPPAGSDSDDLVLIVHPDMLLTPTGISETVSCTRRAILKLRLGSSGLTCKLRLCTVAYTHCPLSTNILIVHYRRILTPIFSSLRQPKHHYLEQ
jgi:hypothetical protein